MGNQKIELDVFSDIACPYCYIGKRHLEMAAQALGIDVIINWRSFLLNIDAPKQTSKDRYTFLAEKYGRDKQWAIDLSANMTEQGQAVGIEFNFDINQPSNTFDAHRLLHLAKAFQCQSQLKEALMKAYFCDGQLIADHDVLVNLAVETGIERSEAIAVLNSQKFSDEVHSDLQMATQYQIGSVPCFIFDQKYAVMGAQPVEKFQLILTQILSQN